MSTTQDKEGARIATAMAQYLLRLAQKKAGEPQPEPAPKRRGGKKK